MKTVIKPLLLFITLTLCVQLPVLALPSHPQYSSHLLPEASHLSQAEAYFQEQQYHLAIQEYEKVLTPRALQADPNLEQVRLILGMAYLKVGLEDKAISQWEKLVYSLKPQPENTHIISDAYFNLGVAYRNKDRITEAIESLKQAIFLNKQSQVISESLQIDAYRILGAIYVEQERWQETVDMMEQAIEIDKQNSDWYDILSYAYLRLSAWAKAEEAAKYSESLAPNHYDGHHLLGIAYCRQGKFDLAKLEETHLMTRGFSTDKFQKEIESFCSFKPVDKH